MITGPCNLQAKVGPLRPGQRQRLDGERYSFITLKPSNIQETGHARAPPRRAGREPRAVDSWMNDADAFGSNAAGDEVVAGALADGVKSRPSVRPGKWSLGSPDRRRNRPGSLGERSGAEEVRDDGAERQSGAGREKQRQLVDVFDQNVRATGRDSAVDGPL